jgi:tetratricopeptide (TPR) repeat protein
MTPEYREMILGEDLTPVSQLSGAFLDPKTPQHLQFAYFESSLVVQYLVQHHGLDTLKRILVDLGVGMPINRSLQRYAGSLEVLDREFAEYARQRARAFAPEVDWNQPDLPPGAGPLDLAAWNQEHPNGFWALQAEAKQWIRQQDWRAAKRPLERLLELCPEYTEADNAYWLLATVHGRLGETEQERAVLEQLAVRKGDAVDAYLRLMELAAQAQDGQATIEYGQRLMAVNPLHKAAHRYMGEAAEQVGDVPRAIESYRSLLLMDPADPARDHYRLARLLQKTGQRSSARRHVLQSLEEAPRFREAHRLLLQLVESSPADERKTDRPIPSDGPEEVKP